MVEGGTGVPEDIPEVSWSIGIAPGPPVIVLGGCVLVDDGLTTLGLTELAELTELGGLGALTELEGVTELTELDEVSEELAGGLGFCLSTRWRWRALWTG